MFWFAYNFLIVNEISRYLKYVLEAAEKLFLKAHK